MKKSFLFILGVLLTFNLYSQSFTQNTYENIDKFEPRWASSTMQGDDGSIFIAVNLLSVDKAAENTTRIMKMSEDGRIIETDYIELSGYSHYGFLPFFRHPYKENTNVYTYTTRNDGEIPVYNAVFFDNDLNILENVSKPLYDGKEIVYSEYESYLLDSENNIIVRIGDGADNRFVFVKMTIDGETLIQKEVVFETKRPISGVPYHSLCVYNENPLQYAFVVETHENGYGLPQLSFMVLDSEFNVVEIKDELLDVSYGKHEYNMIASENSYLTTTSDFSAGYVYNFANLVRLSKFDKNHKLIKEYEYKSKQRDCFIPDARLMYKNLITGKDGDIYWIYTIQGNGQDYYGYRLYVSCFDKDLEHKWDQMILESTGSIFSTTVCDNGNIVLSVVGYNQEYIPIITTIVIRNNGSVLDVNENRLNVNPFVFYPNPADSEIRISFSQDVNCEKVEIYGIDGKLYHEQNFNFNSIDISSLSNGIYMMKVTLNNGNTYTEKVIVK